MRVVYTKYNREHSGEKALLCDIVCLGCIYCDPLAHWIPIIETFISISGGPNLHGL